MPDFTFKIKLFQFFFFLILVTCIKFTFIALSVRPDTLVLRVVYKHKFCCLQVLYLLSNLKA